eukprot:scaffold37173_cov153-Amphora_coffeaeformis.AAC.2
MIQVVVGCFFSSSSIRSARQNNEFEEEERYFSYYPPQLFEESLLEVQSEAKEGMTLGDEQTMNGCEHFGPKKARSS